MTFAPEHELSVSAEATELALRNSIVLNQIFKHLPSNFLITSCSLVNKVWYRLARTFLRNHGICVVPISSHQAYQKIQELEQVCEEIKEEGQLAPFNGLKIVSCYNLNPEWREADPEKLAVYNKMTGLMTLKYLEVEPQMEPLCPLQKEILAWILSGKCSQLQSLNIEHPLFLADLFNSDTETTLQFPRLEVLTIPKLPLDVEEKCVKQMLTAAPNLKRIIVRDVRTLNYLPQDKYKLLVKTPFQVKSAEQETLFRKIVEAKPKLTELQIIPTSTAIYDWDHSDDEDEVDPAVQQRSDNMLERVLQTCHETLEFICVNGLLNPLGRISFPPLINLTKIKMERSHATRTGTEKFWRDISSIEYRRRMPALAEIEIIDTNRPMYYMDESDNLEARGLMEWPTSAAGPLVPPEFSSNAHKLILYLPDKNLNLIPIKSLAPDLTSLEIKIYKFFHLSVDVAPFSDIWTLWPQLVELKVNVSARRPNRNYDADFCGIFEEEAEVLRGQNEEYLQKVHVVPIRPCVLTMARLQKLTLELEFWDRKNSAHSPTTFLSKVTQILAFGRIMDRTDVVVSGLSMLETA